MLFFFLLLNAVALAAGQLLFKSTAVRVKGLSLAAMLRSIAFVPSFYAACVLYAVATVLWVWVLTKVPLSTAYPFVGLFLGETPTVGGCIGMLMVAVGVALIAGSS